VRDAMARRKPTKREARRRLRSLPDIPLPLRRLGHIGRGSGIVTSGAKALAELLITADPLNRTAPRSASPLPQTSRSPESYAREAQLVSGLRDVGRVISDIPIPSFRQRTTGSEQVTPREVIREVVNNPSIEITPEMLPIINDVAILMDSNGDLFEDGFANQFRRDKLLPKKKRKKSKYQVELGKQLKMLKKKHPRTPVTRLMKKAHAATRKALGMRKRSTRKGQVRKTARRAYER